MTIPQTVAGIDIGKDVVDIAVADADERFEMSSSRTDPAALAKLAGKLKKRGVELIVLEATGGLELPVMEALSAAGLGFARVNPRTVRDFARAMGVLAKTDRLDARVLALYGLRLRPQTSQMPTAADRKLNALAVRKRQLVEMRQRERNRSHRTGDALAAASLARMIEMIGSEIEAIDAAMDALIADDEEMAKRVELADSIPGIAHTTAKAVITGLAEAGCLPTRKLKKLVGVAPLNDDSATRQGERHIRGGRAHIRQALYMAAQTGYRHNPALKAFYARLRAKGRSHKQALIACVGKLVAILNAVLRTGKPFDPNYAIR